MFAMMNTFVPRPLFSLDDVDRKLKAAKHNLPAIQQLSPPDSSSSDDDSSPEGDYFPEFPTEEVRPLEQCIAIFETGPRPASASLALLNDEEIIQLANAGKIAPHALEKLLGMDALDRAVRIRRALICTSFISSSLRTITLNMHLQPAHHQQRHWSPQASHTRATTTAASLERAARTSSVSFPFPSVWLAHSTSTASATPSPWPRQRALSSHQHLAAARL